MVGQMGQMGQVDLAEVPGTAPTHGLAKYTFTWLDDISKRHLWVENPRVEQVAESSALESKHIVVGAVQDG